MNSYIINLYIIKVEKCEHRQANEVRALGEQPSEHEMRI